MAIIGYIRVSTDKQDGCNQRFLILEYAQKEKIRVDEFIEISISSTKSQDARRISELKEKVKEGDTIIVTELSRLGRNMLETLNLVKELDNIGVDIVFITQPVLSVKGGTRDLLIAIFGHLAEEERKFCSARIKNALKAKRAQGIKLGRPKGSQNKNNKLAPYHDEIVKYLDMGLSLSAQHKIFNEKLYKPISYSAFRYYIKKHVKKSLPLTGIPK